MSTHAQSMPNEMCVAASAPLQTSSEFVEAVAQLLQKRKVRVAKHLRVRVEAHQMQLRARHAKEWDARHAEHGTSQSSVAQSVKQDRLRSVALAASGKDALCVLMQATPMQLDSGPKTLQMFVAAHWQYQFTTSGGVECVCCAWANVCGIPGVARPPKKSEALISGTYAVGMRMKTSGPKTWRKEVLESHLGLSCGTTSNRKNLHRPGHHHRLAEDSFKLHCAERYRALCPTAGATAVVVGATVVFVRGEAMDIGVAVSDAEAAILSRLVEVYIGLHMCTSIRAISERILLHCSVTSAPGHHASRRWIVEKAIAAMHYAMQDEVTHALFLATFIAVLLDGSDRQRHRINEYAILLIFPGTGPGGMCEVFLGVVDVACGDAHEVATQLECVVMSWIPDRDWWAKRVVTFAVDGASNLGVRGASARQVIDVSHIESNVFALIGKWLVLMTPLGEPCHVLQRKLGLALEAAGPTHVDYLAAVNRQRGLYNGARQWKELQKCVQRHVQDKRSGLQLIPTSHRIRWSQAHARRNTAFLANVPWVARHLDSKVQHSIKEEDVWEDCHDASLLAWGVVYGDILHGMRCFNSVAQLRAPTGAHLATATGMLEARLQRVAREEGPGWLQFKEQTVTGAWRGVQLVQFDSGGQKCATTPPFPGVQARAVTDVLLAGIKEGQATIDPGGVLECAVLLDHGRFVALPVNERAAYGVEQLRQFMTSHQEELGAANVNCDRALVEWEGLKEHMVQHFATVQMSKMWEALAPERAHAQWGNVWRVLALLRTYCPAEAAVERAISLRGRFFSSMHDTVETHVLSMCMALHSNLPPLQQWAKGQGVAVARHLAAHARFDLRPRQRVSKKVGDRESVEAAMLQCLQGNEAVADDGDSLPFFGGPGTPLSSTAPSRKGTERHQADVVSIVAPDGTPDSHAGNHDFITFRTGMECATCKKEVRIWCNTCLVCHACFCASPRPCGNVVVNVVDDVCDEGENNSADELATPRKPNKRRGVARMQAKLVMATQNGRLCDWSKGALLNCLDVLGVKVAGNSDRQELRDLATQHALPLLEEWDAFVPDTDRVTRSAAPPSSSQPSCSQPVDDMDGLIDE